MKKKIEKERKRWRWIIGRWRKWCPKDSTNG